MDKAAYLDAVAADGAALAAAARLGLTAQVPSCPEWKVADLVSHTGMVHAWVTEMVRNGAEERLSWRELPKPPGPDDLVDWFEIGVGVLVSVLREADPAKTVWNWSPQPNTAEFWPRRMANETSVHRWDGQLAHGVQQPIDTELAVDGIDEIIRVFIATDAVDHPDASLGGTLHLHTTDAPGEWLVQIADGKVDVTREHGKGDAALRGPASDLLLFLWGRQPAAPLEVFGDQAIVDNWAKIIDL
ncbi:MAG: maleylpyruvate isomerase family mycothiol-dependent enzyme [Actinobacteria bacterium]|nr:maleylpyruvate isomerase family mycothiol-dependent enzyme [Actinomycetota bacterium]MBV9665820.1 maleylpyruvate isomerase family mycothiol-dependent enzyme [Actinomycetota bacterium]MBV9936327.1 maleylpyruvate isomerase family mycothiol-dependent enzyme [Actinomycetota bacterium]